MNILVSFFAFVLLFQTGDPFAAVEKILKDGSATLKEKQAAFAQLKIAADKGSVSEIWGAQRRYDTAAIAGARIGIAMIKELGRVKTQNLNQNKRFEELSKRADEFISNPKGYDEVMKKVRGKLAAPEENGGPQAPVIRKPKQA